MKRSLVQISASILLINLITIILGYIYVLKSDPLVSYGYSNYNDENKHIFIEMINEGHSSITLKEVKALDLFQLG